MADPSTSGEGGGRVAGEDEEVGAGLKEGEREEKGRKYGCGGVRVSGGLAAGRRGVLLDEKTHVITPNFGGKVVMGAWEASPHQLLIFDFFTLWAASSFEKNHKKSLSFEMTSDFFK